MGMGRGEVREGVRRNCHAVVLVYGVLGCLMVLNEENGLSM